jgi:CheY-like chemotaxis protein
MIFREILESFSFEVSVASSGVEGVNAVAQADPAFDLVVMDWQMPGIDGFEAIRNIRVLAHLARQPKIILATAFAREEVVREAEQADLDGFIIKPVDPSMMLDAAMGAFGLQDEQLSRRKTVDDYDQEALRSVQGASILLAEDNEINQQVARELLEGAGFRVDIANNGVEAVKMVKAGPYDLVLMDVQMPEMDGHEATMRIRQEAAFKDLPILAMTAGAMSEDKEKARQAGMNDHVSKPIEIKQLFDSLVRWITPGDREIPDIDQQADGTGSDADLPRYLEGINISLGLQRVGGNSKLFRGLLLKFRDSQSRAINEIRAALSAGDLDLAARLVHTLKGVAGNIGAAELASAARDLEVGIDDDGADVAPVLLESTQSHLDRVVSALSVIRGDDRSQLASGPADWGQVNNSLIQLRELLEDDDAAASEVIDQLFTQITEEALAEPLRAVELVVANYDFEMALDHLEELEELVKHRLAS